jgi:hypothetical protein
VDAYAAAGRTPQRGGERVHLGPQASSFDLQWQAQAAADERVFVEERVAGEIEHGAILAAALGRYAA